jgi:hypothetical protein
VASVRAPAGTRAGRFDRLVASWFPLTYLLNNLNRGLGIADAYPFVLSPPVVDKLRFVHETVALEECPIDRPSPEPSQAV